MKQTLSQLITIVALLCTATAYASVNIPIHSPFYEDLDILISQGAIISDLSSTKPFTRSEAGRLLAEAVEPDGKNALSSFSATILGRMAREYANEISEAKTHGSAPDTVIKPLDEFSFGYQFLDGPYSLFNNEGIEQYDGHNWVARFQSRGTLWNVFSWYIQPMVLYNQRFRNIDGNDDTRLRLQKGYITCAIDNFEIEIGRDSLWWGPGYHGSLLISNNARPFDMIKLSNPRATLLPWIFSRLGPFKYNMFLSELDEESDSGYPHDSKLFGLRFDFKPHPVFEFGVSYLCHFGGHRPDIEGLNFSDYINILFSNECRDGDKRDSNKEVAIDAAITIPNISRLVPVAESVKVYVEWGAEDAGYPPDKRAYLFGIAFYDLLTLSGVTLRSEYANLSPDHGPGTWYTHGLWPMQQDGRVFGHHAGTDSDDFFLGLSHRLTDRFTYEIGFDMERNGISKAYTQKKQQYFLEADVTISKLFKLTLKYAYETMDNYENIQDRKQDNHYLGTTITLDF